MKAILTHNEQLTTMRKLTVRFSYLAILCLTGIVKSQAQSNYEAYPFITFMGKAGVPGSSDGGYGDARFTRPLDVALDARQSIGNRDRDSYRRTGRSSSARAD